LTYHEISQVMPNLNAPVPGSKVYVRILLGFFTLVLLLWMFGIFPFQTATSSNSPTVSKQA
jgi:hypothetical protein